MSTTPNTIFSKNNSKTGHCLCLEAISAASAINLQIAFVFNGDFTINLQKCQVFRC